MSKSKSNVLEEKKSAPSSSKDLWVQALDLQQQQASESAPTTAPTLREATVIYLGPRGSGKTTLMHHFMFKDRDEVPKPTTTLEYKSTKTSVKDSISDEKSISHFYEVGGGRSLISLLEIPFNEKSITDALIVIVVDLSAPSRVLNDVLFFLSCVRVRCERIFKENAKRSSATPPLAAPLSDLSARQKKAYGENHPDMPKVDVLPIPTMICLNKFDLSASQSPESFKQLCRALRFIAHTNGAHLMFTCRQQRDQFEKAYRQRVLNHVMNTEQTKKPPPMTDPTQPLYVSAGTDSLDNIGDPPSTGTAKTTLGQWIFSLSKLYPSNEDEKEPGAFKYNYNSDPIDLSSTSLTTEDDSEFTEFSAMSNVTTFGDLKLSEEKLIDNQLNHKEEDLKAMIRENITKRKVAAVEVKVK